VQAAIRELETNLDTEGRAAFDRLWREHGPALGRVVAAFAKPGADQDDLTQEIAIAVWRALPRFRGESSERTFALRIAHNRAVSHAWKRRSDETLDEALAAVEPGPERAAQARQDVDRLFAQVRRLPLLQREVLALALEELSHDEIATILGITTGNVAVRLNRARAHLRELMKEGER